MLEVDGEEPLVPCRPAERPGLAVEPRDPHRHARPLDRARQEAHAVDRVVLAPVVDGLTRPCGRQDLERLVEHPRAPPVVDLLARHRVLASELVAAEADPERQPAAAEPVERRRLPGDLDRSPPCERRHHRPEPHARGRGGDRRQRDPRVGDLDDRLPQRTWSHTKTPSQPASSASPARRATSAGSASWSKSGRNRPERTRATLARAHPSRCRRRRRRTSRRPPRSCCPSCTWCRSIRSQRFPWRT